MYAKVYTPYVWENAGTEDLYIIYNIIFLFSRPTKVSNAWSIKTINNNTCVKKK